MKRIELLNKMGMNLPMNRQVRVVISSDVNNEADDQFAIIHQLLTPTFDVKGIIASHYESKAPHSKTTMEKSYQELLKMMEATQIDDIPLLRGCDEPLKDENDIVDAQGVDFIIQEALKEDKRPLYVTVQGTLTDVASAINKCPEICDKMTVIWTGGLPYPRGGQEFNMKQDLCAARKVFDSNVGLWQIPVTVYGTVEVTMGEIAWKVRPCGKIGTYLYEELEAYNLSGQDPYSLRKGEAWNLGDSPVVAALLQSDWGGNFDKVTAPHLGENGVYEENQKGKEIRVYQKIDTRFLLEDMFAKINLCYRY